MCKKGIKSVCPLHIDISALNYEDSQIIVNFKTVSALPTVVQTSQSHLKVHLKNKMLFLLFVLIIPRTFADENCSYFFDDLPYSRSSILTIKGLPTNLVYNPVKKELLFTLIDLDTLQDDNVQTKMDQYILREGKPIKIDNVKGQAAAVDENEKKVYIASDNGLNVLNETDHANFISLKDEDIVQLFKPKHGDKIYAVIYPNNDLYVIDIKKNEKKKIYNVPCAFILAVDYKENIFYECDSKYVKVLLKDFQESVEFIGLPKNTARAMTVDVYNRVILAANDGLYHLRPDNIIPRKLMNLDVTPSGVAFDKDIIYIAANGIIYKYNGTSCMK